MAVIGNSATQQAFTPAVDYFSGNGSTTAFTLSRPVASVAQVQVTIDNVAQNPSSAYTVSGSTITFTSAPLSGTNNIYVYYTSPITQVIAPGQGTVNTTALGNITNIASGNSSLTLQTGSGNTTAVTVDTSQNVGIGTSSPSTKLAVVQNQNGASQVSISNNTGGASSQALFSATDGTNYGQFGMWGSGVSASGAQQPSSAYVYGSGGVSYFTGGIHRWYYNTNTEAMRIDSSGNVGIGTSSPTQKLTVSGAIQATSNSSNFDQSGAQFDYASGAGRISSYISTGSNLQFLTNPNGGASAERMRIDSSGKLIMASNANGLLGQIQAGITANSASTNSVITSTCNSSGPYPFGARGETNTQGLFGFFDGSNSVIGSITKSGSNVAYNTSSDYRLKENIAPMTGALAKVAQLKPVTYTWKADGSDGEGFIAHELAEVKPLAVFGEKDAVNEDGSIKAQGIDTSFLVATLTAAIQELKAINDQQAETINALTARIEALENR